jgi:hypothetical protein
MNIKKWVLNKLGLVTIKEVDQLKRNCEKWAVENLVANKKGVTVNTPFYFPFHGDDVVIIRNTTAVLGGTVSSVKIAPWCQQVSVQGVRVIGDYQPAKSA